MMFYILSQILILSTLYACISASAGDTSKYFRDCVYECESTCDKKSSISLWSCLEDCEYSCQWETVERFIERRWPIPQFGGKWPFIRYFGLQEPASALFSLFNFLIVLDQWRKMRKIVPHQAPYAIFWNIYSLVSLNCWVWSAVYHARDSPTTERLDYLSASCMVFMSFFAMTVRVFELGLSLKSTMWAIVCGCVIINHCAYLWLFRFDYSYNMLFNVIIGAITVVGWLVWSAININKGRTYCKQIAIYSLLMAGSALLEMVDYPPLFWVFDTHALWHLSTCFIIPYFYSFIKKDCLFLYGKDIVRIKIVEKTD